MLTIIVAVTGCGLFTPRTDFEDPVIGTEDYFNFATLIEGAKEKFSKLDWYELFDDRFKYLNVRLANVEYDKTAMINHLSQQHAIHGDAEVVWSNTDDFLKTQDTITLSNVRYSVQTGNSTFSGASRFVIVRSNTIWRIASWIDEPETDPFFSRAE